MTILMNTNIIKGALRLSRRWMKRMKGCRICRAIPLLISGVKIRIFALTFISKNLDF